jgi:hypothetical protein
MMMMFVVTPSLDSIDYEFNSKSIKFPKLHKVPILEAININKPWSEWNFGVKPPKRGIELGWMTRGTRLKRASSSGGFAHEAHEARGTWGSWGSWGLKTENRTFFPLFSNSQQPIFIFIFLNNLFFKIIFFCFFFRASAPYLRRRALSARTQQPVHAGQARGYRGRRAREVGR